MFSNYTSNCTSKEHMANSNQEDISVMGIDEDVAHK